MKQHKLFQLITAIGETLLGFPVAGGLLVIASLWSALAVMLVLHILAFIFCSEAKKNTTGSTLGIVTSLIGWIPVVGMVMHIITAVTLWVSFADKRM